MLTTTIDIFTITYTEDPYISDNGQKQVELVWHDVSVNGISVWEYLSNATLDYLKSALDTQYFKGE